MDETAPEQGQGPEQGPAGDGAAGMPRPRMSLVPDPMPMWPISPVPFIHNVQQLQVGPGQVAVVVTLIGPWGKNVLLMGAEQAKDLGQQLLAKGSASAGGLLLPEPGQHIPTSGAAPGRAATGRGIARTTKR